MHWFRQPSGLARLGVDFGTSNTAAVALRRGGARPLLFDDSPLLPSAVCYSAEEDRLLTGDDAVYASARHPEHYEPNPKRLLGKGPVLLGDREFNAVDLAEGVLSRIAAERTAEGATALAVPVAWGPHRREHLAEAATRAGLGPVSLVEEPVAAAAYYLSSERSDSSIPFTAVVYDLGAGTCDLAALRCDVEEIEVLAVEGIDDFGGLDIDAAVADHLAAQFGIDLTDPQNRRALVSEARLAKERLSRASTVDMRLPGAREDVHLTRGELDAIAAPFISQTVRTTERLLARLPEGGADRLYLVGGAARMPLVATMLHQRLRIAPTVAEQPQLAVAEGCLLVAPASREVGPPPQEAPSSPPVNHGIDYRPVPRDGSGSPAPSAEVADTAPALPSPGGTGTDESDAQARQPPLRSADRRRRRRRAAVATAAAALLALLAAVVPRLLDQGPDLDGAALVVGDQVVSEETVDRHLDWIAEYSGDPSDFDYEGHRPWVIRWFLMMELGEQIGLKSPDFEPEDGAAYKPYHTAVHYFHEIAERAEPRDPSTEEIAVLAEMDIDYGTLEADERQVVMELAATSELLRTYIEEYRIMVDSQHGPDVLLVGPELPFSPDEDPEDPFGGVFNVKLPQF